jgi:hypothetical protein
MTVSFGLVLENQIQMRVMRDMDTVMPTTNVHVNLDIMELTALFTMREP